MNNVSQSARIIILNNILYFLAGSFDIGMYMYVCMYIRRVRSVRDCYSTFKLFKCRNFINFSARIFQRIFCRGMSPLFDLTHVAFESDLSRIKYLSLRSDSFVELSRLLLFSSISFPFAVRKIFCTSRNPLGHSREKQISLGVHTVRFTDTGEFSSN